MRGLTDVCVKECLGCVDGSHGISSVNASVEVNELVKILVDSTCRRGWFIASMLPSGTESDTAWLCDTSVRSSLGVKEGSASGPLDVIN